MNARMLVAAMVLVSLPALSHAQTSCSSCASARSHSVIRPASAELWAGYEQVDCGGCGMCRRCCDPCCTPLLCVVPNTLRRVGRALDCLLPCGPRSGHGCGISCIGAGSGCMPGCCGRPGIFHPKCCDMGCGEVAPPMYRGPIGGELPTPPEPAKETRRPTGNSPFARMQSRHVPSDAVALKSSPRSAAPREEDREAPLVGNGVSTAEHVAPIVNKKPASVLKRISYEEDVPSASARTNWPKNMDVIPHNPLR